MRRSFLFLAVQILSLISTKLAFAQVQNAPVNDDRNVLVSDRIANGTGTCLVKRSNEDLTFELKQMSESQLQNIYDSLKTDEERQILLQLLEEIK